MFCASGASTNFATTESNQNMDRILLKKPAGRAYRMSTNLSTPHAHETSCKSLIRQDSIKTNIVDSERPSNWLTYETAVSTFRKFEKVDTPVTVLGVVKQRKPSLKGNGIQSDSALWYRALQYLAASPISRLGYDSLCEYLANFDNEKHFEFGAYCVS